MRYIGFKKCGGDCNECAGCEPPEDEDQDIDPDDHLIQLLTNKEYAYDYLTRNDKKLSQY